MWRSNSSSLSPSWIFWSSSHPTEETPFTFLYFWLWPYFGGGCSEWHNLIRRDPNRLLCSSLFTLLFFSWQLPNYCSECKSVIYCNHARKEILLSEAPVCWNSMVPLKKSSETSDSSNKVTLETQLFFSDSFLPPQFYKLSPLLLLKRLNDSLCLGSQLLAAHSGCACIFNIILKPNIYPSAVHVFFPLWRTNKSKALLFLGLSGWSKIIKPALWHCFWYVNAGFRGLHSESVLLCKPHMMI